jgi:hypothetical protein
MKKIFFIIFIVLTSCTTTQHWIYVKEGAIITKYDETIKFDAAEVYRCGYFTEVNLYGGTFTILNKDIKHISLDAVYVKE